MEDKELREKLKEEHKGKYTTGDFKNFLSFTKEGEEILLLLFNIEKHLKDIANSLFEIEGKN